MRPKSSSLAPGFRFHPTDEELVRYYLKRKVLNKPSFDAISVIDIYRSEPWDLPDKSKLKSRDLEWYFFSALDKKYGNGLRTNRATDRGYWKTTGKDRPIRYRDKVVGMKKTLVYHKGRAPTGERSNWVMHEYRLTDETLEKAGIQQDAFVLCRVFQKSGSGPKNGENYGAPFIEEEWEDDEAAVVPGPHAVIVNEEVTNDNAFVEVNDIDQKLDIGNPSENAVNPINFYHGESSNHVEYSREFSEDYQMPTGNMSDNAFPSSNFYHGEPSNYADQSRDFGEDYQKSIDMHASQSEYVVSDLPGPNVIVATEGKPVKDEYVFEPIENFNPVDNSYLFEETPYLGVTDHLPTSEGFFLEANDLSNPIDPDSEFFDLDEYLTFDDANEQPLPIDSGSEIPVSGQESFVQMHSSNEGAEQVLDAFEHEAAEQVPDAFELKEDGESDASSSKQELEATKLESGTKYPFLKHASHMLGSFPAPPAFASEFPSKDATLKLNSAAQASSSVHVIAGIIRISNMTSSGNRLDWSYNKNGSVNIVLSFSLPQGDVNSSRFLPVAGLLSGKTVSAVGRGWFFFMLFFILIASVSLKFHTCIHTR